MNARALWTFALACALNIGSLNAASGADEPMRTMSERLEIEPLTAKQKQRPRLGDLVRIGERSFRFE